MLTEKTGAGNNWEQFMRVKTQARMRNSGLGTQTAVASAELRSTAALKSTPAGVRYPSATSGISRGDMYRAVPQADTGKIVGGKFDAWA